MTTIVTPNLNDAVTAAQTYVAQAAASATAAVAAGAQATTAATTAVTNHIYGILTSDPTKRPDFSPIQQGDIYYNSTLSVLRMYVNTAWATVAITPLSVAQSLLAGNNLADIASASAARANLGLGTAAIQNSTAFMQSTNNLSDLQSIATARSNLGIAAVATSGSASDLTTGTLPAARLTTPAIGALGGLFSNVGATHKWVSAVNTDGSVTLTQPSQSDISGLGTAATQNTGAFLQPGNNLSDVSSTSAALLNLGAMGSTFFYGDGSDGNVTVSTGTSLTRDMCYNNLTVAAGAAITTNGYRIYVRGILDITAAPAGAFLANGTIGISGGAGGTTARSTQNIAGSVAGAFGGNGASGTSATSLTGFGGSGGTGGSAGGGSGGVMTKTGWVGPLAGWDIGYTQAISTKTAMAGGGGGGGGGDGGSGTAAGGGGGGGTIIIVANTIARGSNATASIIQAKGGAGGSGGASSGGGGGGGGGFVLIIVGTLTGSAITNSVDVSSGGGGNGTTTGTGGGASGGGGAYWILTVSAQTLVQNASTGGNAASSGTGGAAVTARYSL